MSTLRASLVPFVAVATCGLWTACSGLPEVIYDDDAGASDAAPGSSSSSSSSSGRAGSSGASGAAGETLASCDGLGCVGTGCTGPRFEGGTDLCESCEDACEEREVCCVVARGVDRTVECLERRGNGAQGSGRCEALLFQAGGGDGR